MKILLVEVFIIIVVSLFSIFEGIRLYTKESVQLYDILGPGLYNVGLGSILMIVGLFYLISNWKKTLIAEKQSANIELKRNREYQKKMISMILVMAAFIFLMDFIGFLFASAVFFFLINRIVGFRSWSTNVGVTILMTVSTYIIFVTWLGMIFPRGILFDFF